MKKHILTDMKLWHFTNPIGSMYGIYANIGGILMGSMLPYIAAPWILWDCQITMFPWFSYGFPMKLWHFTNIEMNFP